MKMPPSDKFMENYRSCCSSSRTRLKVKTVAQEKSLDFNADRLDVEDWQPLIKALKYDRKLHTLAIKSEYPGKQWRCSIERVKPALHKPSIMNDLLESIAVCMKRSSKLSTVQLQSLPLNKSNIETLAKGLKECESLQNLTLKNFSLTDDGLQVLYDSICPHVGLSVINLTGCSLTTQGAYIIAKIIRTQRLARYDETWKQSLRYREPNQETFPGIRRITLNDNPEIGDDGFSAILHELMDDLWVRAIDAQNCGLTTVSGNESINLVKINDTIRVLDLSRNDKVTGQVKRKIKELLVERLQKEMQNARGAEKCKQEGHQVYEWLQGSSEMTCGRGSGSSRDPNSIFSACRVDDLTAPSQKNRSISNSQLTTELHQAKRVLDDTRRHLLKEREKFEELENQKREQKVKLAEKFTKEWKKRKQIERERDRLKEELKGFLSEGHIPKTKSIKSMSTVSTISKKRKTKKPKSKAKCEEEVDIFSKPNIIKHNSMKNAKTLQKTSRSQEKIKRQSIKDNYEISNTQEVQMLQKNLDKLNFNMSKEPLVPSHASDADSELGYVNYNQNQTFYKPANNEFMNTKHEHNMINAAQKNLRDLSPISRSQWIFNEIMMGKKREIRSIENNFNSWPNNEKNDKCFNFGTTAKWEVKV